MKTRSERILERKKGGIKACCNGCDGGKPCLSELRFIHIPKTAGQSISRKLAPNKKPHKTLSEIEGEIEEKTFLFSVIRNPYDRATSLFYYFQQLNEKGKLNKNHFNAAMCATATGAKDVNTFWVDFITPNIFEYLNNYSPMFKPQTEFLKEGEENISNRFNAILLFENLEDDWSSRVSKFFKLGKLQHRNSSRHDHWKDLLSEEAKKRIAELYELDFETLPYNM